MLNAGVDKVQAAITISRRNIDNHRHANDINLMAESEEVVKSLDEIERVWLNAQHSEN